MLDAGDIIHSQLLAEQGIQAFFTTRTGDASKAPYDSLNFGADGKAEHVAANIARLIACAGPTTPPHQARQVHQCGSMWCVGSGGMHQTAADILLTRCMDVPVAVRTADCLPVLLADPVAGMVAAVHAGWRGTTAGVVIAAINEMLRRGAHIEDLFASLGPCIGPCCFHIGEEAATALTNCVEGAAYYIQHHPLRADLAAINHLQLRMSGIPEQHIERCRLCTMCDPQRFFSHRRDARRSGRQLAVVAIPSAT